MSVVACKSTQAPELIGQNLRELRKERAIPLSLAMQLHSTQTFYYEENDRSAQAVCMDNMVKLTQAILTQAKFRRSEPELKDVQLVSISKEEILDPRSFRRLQLYKMQWWLHKILCMRQIIDLNLAISTQSKFWKSDQNWWLSSQIQYYTQERNGISQVFSPQAAIQHAVMCTANTLYDVYYSWLFRF